ncbi:MAG TPA: hypothetical protein VL383_08275 [Gemmatimonadaceae bacterium]|nr:hypothetical protein [Gemmatimonadaceae bacterium]
MRLSRRRSAAVLCALLATAAPSNTRGARAQGPARHLASRSWTVARDPFVDLWFHALATVGYEGFGPLALYDVRDAERTRVEKRSMGVSTTLDRKAVELRAAFAADSAFEILHFVPLYFAGQDPDRALASLRRALERTNAPDDATARLIVSSLPLAREQANFRTFVDAVDDEWKSFLRQSRALHSVDDARSARELQLAWESRFARPLAWYLDAMGLTRGTIIVSPAVGSEGRIVRDADGSAVVAVSSARRNTTIAPLLMSVRELAFPLLDRLHTRPDRPARVAAARARDAAAVRAGALILDASDTVLATEYRRLFLDLAGSRTFESAYPIDISAEAELRGLIAASARSLATRGSSYENP